MHWFKEFFEDCADCAPNRKQQQIELVEKREIWERYKFEIIDTFAQPTFLDYNSWLNIWNTVFPNVRIRRYKQVTGKCWTCHWINEGRETNKNNRRVLRALKEAHQLHRGGLYGLERKQYKKRCAQAINGERSEVTLSLIIDGMDQQHCLIPHTGTEMSFGEPLNQHITGCMSHGSSITLYRTFCNISKGANLTIFCVLKEIEKFRKEHNGAFPEEIFLQIDGGSENANKFVLAMMELLVAKRLVKKVWYTRLPTGHTHEDIDAVFALLWEWFKGKNILTPQQYKDELEEFFKESPSVHFRNLEVEDVFIVPDYIKFLQSHIDHKLAKLHTLLHTQHQWLFEAVKKTEYFPFGVKATYRPYSSERVVEFRKLPTGQCQTPIGQLTGLEPNTSYCKWEPEPTAARPVEGIYLLHYNGLPCSDEHPFEPEPFEEGARAQLDKTYAKIKSTYNTDHLARAQWEEWFQDEAPTHDGIEGAEAYRACGFWDVPLSDFFETADPCEDVCAWEESSLSANPRLNPSVFQWPELVALCNPSVATSFTPHPPNPRTYLGIVSSDNNNNIMNRFTEESRVYYLTFLTGHRVTRTMLQGMLR